DEAKRTAKVKEANEVVKHYGKIVEDRMHAAVKAEWQKYLARKKHLSDFRVKSGVKVALGTIGIGVAVASAALSFGALWMNVLAAAKGALDLAQVLKTLTEAWTRPTRSSSRASNRLTSSTSSARRRGERGRGRRPPRRRTPRRNCS